MLLEDFVGMFLEYLEMGDWELGVRRVRLGRVGELEGRGECVLEQGSQARLKKLDQLVEGFDVESVVFFLF